MAQELSLSLRARVALEANGFRFTHSLGQNFLLDEDVVDRIVDHANVSAGTNVLEIGPGAGVMTALMARRGANVLALELDRALEPVLNAALEGLPGVRVVFEDALKADLNALVKEAFGAESAFSVVANLPYYITADFLSRAVRMRPAPECVTVMVQKEAAERVLSSPGEKNWCALAATVQYFADAEAVMDAPARLFTPPPHVDSRLIRLSMKKERLLPPDDDEGFVNLIQAAFRMRRKTLLNNLTAAYGLTRERAQEVIEAAGFDARVRGEALTLGELSRLYRCLRAALPS